MNNKIVYGGILIAVIIAIGGYVFPKSFRTVQEIVTGSVAGPVLESDYWTVNSVEHQYRSANFNVATTTPCSFRSPSATSTLLFTSLQVNKGSSTATTWTLATSTIPNATTTKLTVPFSLGSGARGTMTYTGTTTSIAGGNYIAGQVDGLDVVPPNTYLTWGVTGISGFTSPNTMLGSCKAEFIVN